jgi:WD40 repeat protein
LCLVNDRVWSGGEDNSVRVWEDGAQIRHLKEHRGWVNAISQAGRQVWTGSSDKTVLCWDAASFQVLHVLDAHTAYVKSIVRVRWQMWTCGGDRAVCVYVGEGIFDGLQDDVDSLGHEKKRLEVRRLVL